MYLQRPKAGALEGPAGPNARARCTSLHRVTGGQVRISIPFREENEVYDLPGEGFGVDQARTPTHISFTTLYYLTEYKSPHLLS